MTGAWTIHHQVGGERVVGPAQLLVNILTGGRELSPLGACAARRPAPNFPYMFGKAARNKMLGKSIGGPQAPLVGGPLCAQ